MNCKKTFLSLIVLSFVIMGFKKDKCNPDGLYSDAMKRLGKYTFLKDYKIYMKKNKHISPEDYEYYVLALNRGVKYKFYAVNSEDFDGKLVINLYNNTKREFLFATTLNQVNNTVKESIEFECQRTGNFCVGYYFTDGKEGCGVGVSAFKAD